MYQLWQVRGKVSGEGDFVALIPEFRSPAAADFQSKPSRAGSGCATTHESSAGALGIPEFMPPAAADFQSKEASIEISAFLYGQII